jgi:fused signal recognition particle receptor
MLLKKRDEKKEGFFQKFKQKLSKTRDSITGRLDRIFFGKKEITEEILDEIEEILFTSDIGVETAQNLIDTIRRKVNRKELKDLNKLKLALKEEILNFLETPPKKEIIYPKDEPLVIMMVGVNGVGKTTTIGKLAYQMHKEGKKVLLVAADTFRAAAVEQLSIWAERAGAELVKKDEGTDPSAVVFDSIDIAKKKGFDVIIIDTAGRLHTKKNLMEELKKIKRVCNKKLAGAPHEIWLVLDATTGQNAISQAKMFHDALQLTGIILTKLDGTAKGGVIVGISHQLKIPVIFVGIGEAIDDLKPFEPKWFVDALFD